MTYGGYLGLYCSFDAFLYAFSGRDESDTKRSVCFFSDGTNLIFKPRRIWVQGRTNHSKGTGL